MSARARCIFSVDVEDWFHVLDVASAPPIEQWDTLPSLVERNFRTMLDLFDEKGVSVTCFFLGWVARRHPHLVREAAARGHEIASHGYAHQLVYTQTPEAFHADVSRARRVLEDLTGRAVLGYRSPGFSATADTPWFFEKLVEAGYGYDSSVFPAPRGHGGLATAERAPYVVRTPSGPLLELPITVSDLLGRPMCFFGGGYLRLFPWWLVRRTTTQVLAEGRPVVFYIHPREIDPEHPRLPMPPARRFKTYVNLDTTAPKLRALFDAFPVTTFERYITENRSSFAA